MTITQGNPTRLLIDPEELPPSTHQLILESFDQNGGIFSILKEDIITINVVWEFNRYIPLEKMVQVENT